MHELVNVDARQDGNGGNRDQDVRPRTGAGEAREGAFGRAPGPGSGERDDQHQRRQEDNSAEAMKGDEYAGNEQRGQEQEGSEDGGTS